MNRLFLLAGLLALAGCAGFDNPLEMTPAERCDAAKQAFFAADALGADPETIERLRAEVARLCPAGFVP